MHSKLKILLKKFSPLTYIVEVGENILLAKNSTYMVYDSFMYIIFYVQNSANEYDIMHLQCSTTQSWKHRAVIQLVCCFCYQVCHHKIWTFISLSLRNHPVLDNEYTITQGD